MYHHGFESKVEGVAGWVGGGCGAAVGGGGGVTAVVMVGRKRPGPRLTGKVQADKL